MNTRRRPALSVTRLEDRSVPSTVQGVVFDDTDGTGVQNAGEGGRAGAQVYIDGNRDILFTAGEPTALTAADGSYSFTGIGGPYAVVRANVPDAVPGDTGRLQSTTPSGVAVATNSTPNPVIVNFGQQFHAYAEYQPIGSEVRSNPTATGLTLSDGNGWFTNDIGNSVASSPALGRFATVWREFHFGGTDRILARLFDADGNPLSPELVVDAAAATKPPTGQAFDDRSPVVAMTADGRFAVAWHSYNAANNTYTAYARSFAANGTAASARLQVTPVSATVSNGAEGIAMDANGGFAVLYHGGEKSKNWGWNDGIVGFRRYTATGSPVGSATQVVDAGLINGEAAIGMASDGRFVVAWREAGGATGIYAQRYDSSGRKSGQAVALVPVPSQTIGFLFTSLAVDGSGRFVASWGTDSGGQSARQFNANGTAAGPVLALGSGAGRQAATFEPDGGVLFAWTNRASDGVNVSDVRVRRLSPTGVLELDYVANGTTDGIQGRPGVASLGGGKFAVGWLGYGVGGDQGVFSQVFGPPAGPLAPMMGAPAEPIATTSLDNSSEEVAGAKRIPAPSPADGASSTGAAAVAAPETGIRVPPLPQSVNWGIDLAPPLA